MRKSKCCNAEILEIQKDYHYPIEFQPCIGTEYCSNCHKIILNTPDLKNWEEDFDKEAE